MRQIHSLFSGNTVRASGLNLPEDPINEVDVTSISLSTVCHIEKTDLTERGRKTRPRVTENGSNTHLVGGLNGTQKGGLEITCRD